MSINNIMVILITTLANILTIIIVLNAILSFFLSPFHPIRMALGQVLEPIYAPIRRVLPPMGMIDFTPLVVLLIINVIERLILSLLLR